MKKIFVLILLCSFAFASAQQVQKFSRSNQPQPDYDEKAILLTQAKRYSSRRNYEKANQILRELMDKFPQDHEIVQNLLNNLMRTSEYDKSAQLLADKKDIMPPYEFLRYQIPLLLRDGDTKKAFAAGDQYLQQNKNNVNEYRKTAQIFSGSRQYEKAAQILEQARKITNDQYLNTLDLARAYQSQEKNHLAAREYLKHLEKNKNYLHYVMNNLKGILNRDPKVISTIQKFSQKAQNQYVTEAYALSLAHIGQYSQALLQYQNLESIKLLNFAEELAKMKKFQIALNAYNLYESRENEPHFIAEAQLARAQIYLQINDFQNAQSELINIYQNNKITKGKYRYKTQAAKICRLLLADLALRKSEPQDVVISYLNEAAEFANNNAERKKINFSIIDYRIKSGDLNNAQKELNQILINETQGTDIYKQSLFYVWQIALMQKDAAADSLLGELIINLPKSPLTTQALYLTQISTSLEDNYHEQLFQAWRLRGLYRDQQALDILQNIIEQSDNDEIKILAANWKKRTAPDVDPYWWQQDFTNPLLSEYSRLMQMKYSPADSTRIQISTDFLKQYPQSIFAPQFRNELNKHLQED